jgi:hypothetical protein
LSTVPATVDLRPFIGRAPESLEIGELNALHGVWAAVELYSPATTPLRRIAALGPTPAACLQQLDTRGLDPLIFELMILRRPC